MHVSAAGALLTSPCHSAMADLSTVATKSAAASSNAPPAVIQECCASGERKKMRAGREVWLSWTSANQPSHSSQIGPRRSSPPMLA